MTIFSKFGGFKKFWCSVLFIAALSFGVYISIASCFCELRNVGLLESVFYGMLGAALVLAGASTLENLKRIKAS
jgi:hypothetical protein